MSSRSPGGVCVHVCWSDCMCACACGGGGPAKAGTHGHRCCSLGHSPSASCTKPAPHSPGWSLIGSPALARASSRSEASILLDSTTLGGGTLRAESGTARVSTGTVRTCTHHHTPGSARVSIGNVRTHVTSIAAGAQAALPLCQPPQSLIFTPHFLACVGVCSECCSNSGSTRLREGLPVRGTTPRPHNAYPHPNLLV